MVVEILGETYTEMQTNYNNIINLVSHEKELFTALYRSSENDVKRLLQECPELEELDLISSPGFYLGYKELKNFTSNSSKLSATELAFKLYDTYGLDNEAIMKLTDLFNVKFDKLDFENLMNATRLRTKGTFSHFNMGSNNKSIFLQKSNQLNLRKTDDSFKYNYTFDVVTNIFKLKNLKSKVVAILDSEYNFITDVNETNSIFHLITEETNFYSESGGQESDLGIIKSENAEFEVIAVDNIGGYILHTVRGKDKQKLSVTSSIELIPDEFSRTKNICNHTGM